MGGGDLNAKKAWHPSTLKNQERVWKAEQAAAEEKKRIVELERERQIERDRAELNKLARSNLGPPSSSNDDRLHWMYEKPDKKVQHEDFLLGKAIDKNNDPTGKAEADEIPAVSRRVIGSSMLTISGDTQVDLARKMREDPLLLVKERERAARAALLNNPVQRARLTQLLRKEQETDKEKKSKKEKKKNKDLDNVLAEKLQALSGNKGIDLATLLASDDSSSECSDEKPKKKKKKKDKKRKKKTKSKKHSSEDSTSETDINEKAKAVSKKESRKSSKERKRKSTIESSDEKSKRKKRSNSMEKRNQQSNHKVNNRNSSEDRSSDDEYQRENRRTHDNQRSKYDHDEVRNRQLDDHSRDQKHVKNDRSSRSERRDRDLNEDDQYSKQSLRHDVKYSRNDRHGADRSNRDEHSRDDRYARKDRRNNHSSEKEKKEWKTNKRSGLNEEEKAAKLAEMVAAGAEREKQRARRVAEQLAEKEKPDRATHTRSRNVVSQLPDSLESRIHSNRHYIQRDQRHMNEHFARR